MRKRLLSILLTLCMVFGLLPQMALAEEITYTSGGDVTNTGLDLNTAPIQNTEYTTAGGGKIFWQPTNKTLILNNAKIDTTTSNAFAVTLKADEDVNIMVEGEDNVLKAKKCGIGQAGAEPSTDTTTTIKGNGKLEVTTAETETTQGAICLNFGNLTISDGVEVTPVVPDYQYSAIYVYNGNVSILGSASVISSSQTYLRVNQGTINIDTEGTITQSFMYLKNNFNYTQGDVNAWVMKANYSNSPQLKASFVYGHFTLTYNQTIVDMDGEDGLTVMDGATLTINSGMPLTVEDEPYSDGMPKITNNGNIENNGTIQYQDTVNEDTILALTANGGTLTGNGKVMKGTVEVAPVNAHVYEVADIVTDKGLDLSTTTPTTNTCYKAGDGYILWQSTVDGGNVTRGTVTLQNASIETANTALYLPGGAFSHIDVTVVAEGENRLISTGTDAISHQGGETIVQGNGTLNLQGKEDGLFQNNGNLTITGDVTVNATGGENNDGIKGSHDITISGNANVTAKGGTGIYGRNITINTTGTVNAPEIIADKVFTNTAGKMTGSWVREGKTDYYENEVNTVYGNMTLVGEKIISDLSQLKGLTIMEGATLTIDNGSMVTIKDNPYVDGVPKIINNGTIENYGTIKFPEGTTGADIQKIKNITGNGTIMIGDRNIAIVNGVLYPDGGDISDAGVDFTVDTPTADTYYKAGSGYMIFSPTSGTLTMNNAVITNDQPKPLITLPQSNIKLVLEGENALTNISTAENFAPAIQQGQLTVNDNDISILTPQNYNLTVSGNGSLATITKSQNYSISTDGTFVMESGNLKSGNEYDKCFGIETADFKMTGGSLEASLGLRFLGNALVEGGTLFTPGGNNGIINGIGNFKMTGGTVTCGASGGGGLIVSGDIIKTGGTLNALGRTFKDSGEKRIYTLTPYGSDAMMYYNNNGDVKGAKLICLGNVEPETFVKLNIPSGSTLTIPKGAVLDACMAMEGLSISDYVTNNGSIVNNGTIYLPGGTTAEEVKAAAGILKATGSGIIIVPGIEDDQECYTNSGDPMNFVQYIDLGTTEASGDGYTWKGNPTDGFKLTLDNVYVKTEDIHLPSDVPVTIELKGTTIVNEGIEFNGKNHCNLTFTGTGTLNLDGGIYSRGNNDSIIVKDKAKVNVGGIISIGSIDGKDGTLTVDGKEAELSVLNPTGDGVHAPNVEVINGGHMTVHSADFGIFVNHGGVTVISGSTLDVGCEYGVYIVDGKLTIDKTSKLITNGSVAPFCVEDNTNTKAESDMVSLPGLPSGTQIASVQGQYGTYWSLVRTGDTLGVDENSEPITLTGAVKDNVTFAFKKKKSSDDDSNNGGGSFSSSYTITAKAEKGGNISPDGTVSISKNEDKTFTITANKGYEVKDVLVDGASVGKVTKYTFEDVTKAHTITASFVETKDEAKEEAKEENKEEVPATKASFGDVKDGDWFKKAVDYVTENGLMSGTSDKEFAPNLSTTRGMIVTILWRLEGQPSAKAKANFTDVADGEYYAEAVAWAAENNIVGGYGNGIFAPNDVITREQLASILYRYSKFKGYDTTQGGMAVKEFSDYSQLSSWAGESTSWAVNAGLISGTGNSQLDPKGSATRGQVASILMRYCEDVAK